MLKAPVWTWEVPVYFFVGGLAGMAAVLGLAAALAGPGPALPVDGERAAFLRAALALAAGGGLASAALLVMDLGRPRRFLNMLRVFKWRSPMSVGAWILALFGAAATGALLLLHLAPTTGGEPTAWSRKLFLICLLAAGPLGAVLATYTGVLVAATAVPVWFLHRRLLPLHFGAAALGSAAATLELLGFRLEALWALGVLAAALETAVAVALEARRRGGARDRALREGRAGLLVRGAGLLAGPLALFLRLGGLLVPAAVAFLAGALLARFGWLEAGRASARDPEATFATQRPGSRGATEGIRIEG